MQMWIKYTSENLLRIRPSHKLYQIASSQFSQVTNASPATPESTDFLVKYGKLFEKSKAIEMLLPREIKSGDELKKFCPDLFNDKNEYDKADIQAVNKALIHPIYDLLDRGGKRWRPILGLMVASAFGRNIQHFDSCRDIYYTCALTEIVHNASLIVDDLEDASVKRRGDYCTYIKFGADVALNAGNFIFFAPIQRIGEFVECEKKQLELIKIFNANLVSLHLGQNWDIYWHNGSNLPSEEQYLQMVLNKTSVLPRLCIKFVSALQNLDEKTTNALTQYTESLGAAFQIQDDIISVVSEEYSKERGFVCEDIHEGKRTIMVLHCMRTNQEKGKRLLEILNMKTEKEELLQEGVRILKEGGSVDYAKERAREIMTSAWENVRPFIPDGEEKDDLERLSQYLIKREL